MGNGKCGGISSGMAAIRMECYVKLATIKDHFKLLSFASGPPQPRPEQRSVKFYIIISYSLASL